MFPLFLSYLLNSKGLATKMFYGMACILVLMALVATGSRGGILAFVAGIIAYLYFQFRSGMISIGRVFLIIFSLPMVFFVSYNLAPQKIRDRMIQKLDVSKYDLNKKSAESEFTSGRSMLAENALAIFTESPIFGHGQDTFTNLQFNRFHVWGLTHNEYLAFLVEQGIIGLLAVFFVFYRIYRIVRTGLKTSRDTYARNLYLAYLTGLIGFMVAMSGVNLFDPRVPFWIYTAAVLGYLNIQARRAQQVAVS
jgi:O-antigen ligase